jgi:hypothetical protein
MKKSKNKKNSEEDSREKYKKHENILILYLKS